jgi:hypothetical protein
MRPLAPAMAQRPRLEHLRIQLEDMVPGGTSRTVAHGPWPAMMGEAQGVANGDGHATGSGVNVTGVVGLDVRRDADPEQPKKRLCGFSRVTLAPGAGEPVKIEINWRDIAHFDTANRCWILGTQNWILWLGASSADEDLVRVSFELPERAWSIRER